MPDDRGPSHPVWYADSSDRMLMIAVAVAVGSSVVGTIASFHIDGATAPCIVLTQALVFLQAFLFAPQRGLLASRQRVRAPARI